MAEWTRLLTARDAGVSSGHHESDFGQGGTFTVLAVQEEAEVIWGREVIWFQCLLTQGGWQGIQEGASQLLPVSRFSLVLFAKSERSNILSEAAAPLWSLCWVSSSPLPSGKKRASRAVWWGLQARLLTQQGPSDAPPLTISDLPPAGICSRRHSITNSPDWKGL